MLNWKAFMRPQRSQYDSDMFFRISCELWWDNVKCAGWTIVLFLITIGVCFT